MYWTLPEAASLKTQNPAETALQRQRADEARAAHRPVRHVQRWVPLRAVSKVAVASVVLSEDASFYTHDGVDTVELQRALDEAVKKGKLGRGASTITQQLAKNLWLSTDRSLLRKVKELVLAKRLEHSLSKSRILELYLNVVEWGDGVYGIEAASLEHFGVHASELDVAHGAMLASMLPNPRKRLPRLKPLVLQRHSLTIISRMEAVHRLDPVSAELARRELARFFGRTATEEDENSASADEEASPVISGRPASVAAEPDATEEQQDSAGEDTEETAP